MKRKLMLLATCALLYCFAAVALSGCATEQKKAELEIYAANSLSEAMDEAQKAYTEKNPNITFADTQYEASGTLVKKIESGGTPDAFISANQKNMTNVVNGGYAEEGKPFNLFKNDLVIVTSENNTAIDSITVEEALSGNYTVSIGDDNVPAGTYARQVFYNAGCYTSETGSNGEITGAMVGKVNQGDKVGSVCQYAQNGEVDLAFVYSSDVKRYGGVKVVCTVPSSMHKEIVYPATVMKNSENAEATEAFLKWCSEDAEAQKIWQKWGFELA